MIDLCFKLYSELSFVAYFFFKASVSNVVTYSAKRNNIIVKGGPACRNNPLTLKLVLFTQPLERENLE